MVVNKPTSMSVREWLTKLLSTKEATPQSTISAVITHQFDGAYEALKTKNSIELAGFGKFYYNVKRSEKEMSKLLLKKQATKEVLLDDSISDKKRVSYEKRLNTVNNNILFLKDRNNE